MAGPGLTAALSPERQAFAEHLFALAAEAGERAGGFEQRDVRIAGLRLRLRFAGAALREAMTPAFDLSHAPAPGPDEPDLSVDLWDSAETGVRPSPPPWEHEDYREHGRIRGLFGDGIYANYLWGSNSLSVLDTDGRRALYWRDDPDLPWFERAAPLRTPLHLFFAERGLQFLHGAVVGTAAGVALVAGPSGAGKSSTALSCLAHSGLGLLADDYSLAVPAGRRSRWGAGPGEGAPELHRVFATAKVAPEGLERFPALTDLVVNPERPPGEKAMLDLAGRAPERLLGQAPLRAIVVPRLARGRESALAPATAAAALTALAPSTILQLPGSGAESMRLIADLARTVPAYRLDAGTNPAGVATRIAELLGR